MASQDPAALYDAVYSALRARPARNLSTDTELRRIYADTVAALASCGVKLTPTQIQRIHWSDELRTLWEQAEYVIERHYGARGLRVIWPARGDSIRVIPKRLAA